MRSAFGVFLGHLNAASWPDEHTMAVTVKRWSEKGEFQGVQCITMQFTPRKGVEAVRVDTYAEWPSYVMVESAESAQA